MKQLAGWRPGVESVSEGGPEQRHQLKKKKSKIDAAAVVENSTPIAPRTSRDAERIGWSGFEPTNLEKYNKFESTSYLTSDTAKQEALLMRMTKRLWTRRRSFLWFLYAVIGVSVSLLIFYLGALWRHREGAVKAANCTLKDGDIGMAYLIWVGTSLGMTLFAASLVLIEPAAASSGIPGLIAYLIVSIHLGASPITQRTLRSHRLKR